MYGRFDSSVDMGALGLLMLMGSNFLIKVTRPQNIVLFILMFCNLVIFIKNIDPMAMHQHQEA